MKELRLNLRVRIAALGISDEEVTALISRLIACGVEEAKETLRDGEGDLEQATLAAALEIDAPTVIQFDPRVLVVARDNGAEAFSDDGVQVVLFNQDDHDDSPEDVELPPASFKDLADQANVPYANT